MNPSIAASLLLFLAAPGVFLRAEDLIPPERLEISRLVRSADGHRLSSGDRLFGATDLSFDYQLAPGESASLYLEGVYRVPLAGWPPAEGLAGKVDANWSSAAKAPGLWQHVHLVFHPAQVADGHRQKPALLESAEENNFPVASNLSLEPSPEAPLAGENPAGPLIFISDHPLQLRNLELRPVGGGKPASLEVTKIELLQGWNPVAGGSAADADWAAATALPLKTTLSAIPPHSAARFSGSLTLPAKGTYAFAAHSDALAQIYLDGSHVLGPLELSAGPHEFQLVLVRREEASPTLSVELAGSNLPAKTFYLGGGKPKSNPERHPGAPMLKLAADKIVVQRAFVPFPGGERLEAISVGTPQQVNYTYDLDRGTLLRAWRGPFLDMYNMWHERGEAQIALPLGAALVLDGGPTFGEILQPGGYDLEPNGQPVFTAHFHGRTITDRIAPNGAGGLTRTLRISAGPEPVTLVLARGGEMAESNANHFTVSDRSYYLNWHSPATEVHPAITGQGDSAALTVTLPASGKSQEISYDLSW